MTPDLTSPIAAPSRRILARTLEGAIPIVGGLLLSALGVALGSQGLVRSGGLVALLGGLVIFAVNAYLLASRGQTLGKIPMKLRVLRPDGTLPGLARGFLVRELLASLLTAVPVLGVMFALVDAAMLVWTDKRRSLHDELADTIVVDERAPAPQR